MTRMLQAGIAPVDTAFAGAIRGVGRTDMTTLPDPVTPRPAQWGIPDRVPRGGQ